MATSISVYRLCYVLTKHAQIRVCTINYYGGKCQITAVKIHLQIKSDISLKKGGLRITCMEGQILSWPCALSLEIKPGRSCNILQDFSVVG